MMRRTRLMLVAVLLHAAVAGSALAALPQKPGPPKAPAKMIVYGSYIAVAVLLGVVCVPAFKPSKRSHQD